MFRARESVGCGNLGAGSGQPSPYRSRGTIAAGPRAEQAGLRESADSIRTKPHYHVR